MFDRFRACAHLDYYPAVPAGWPNRATRRAVQGNRESRLTGPWREALVRHPELRKAITAMRQH